MLYLEPFFKLRVTEIKSLAGFKFNGSQTNPPDVIFQKRELSALGSFYSRGGLSLWGRNHGRYLLLGYGSGQLYRSFGRRLSKLLPNNTEWRTIRRRSFLHLMCVLHTRTQPSATEVSCICYPKIRAAIHLVRFYFWPQLFLRLSDSQVQNTGFVMCSLYNFSLLLPTISYFVWPYLCI